ncbi:MAG: hypothetical protein KDA91_04805 [Planctomycetaceae bacterium]|nr:hypothetical protein [Planctomycetaceae bacterium]
MSDTRSFQNVQRKIRTIVPAVVLCLLSSEVLAQNTGSAAKKTPGEDMVLRAGDGFPIHITYFAGNGGKESPVAVLLPSTEGPDAANARNRRAWQDTALALQKDGYAVVTVDLRKHGDSIPDVEDKSAIKLLPTDHTAMAALDLEAVKSFLMEQHQAEQLNVRKMGIVAAGSSCIVASAFAVEDWAKKPYKDAPLLAQQTPRGQDVRAIVMLSPKGNVKGLNSARAMKALGALPVAAYILASTQDKAEIRDADKLFKSLELKGEEFDEVRKITRAPIAQSAEQFIEGKEAETTIRLIKEFFKKNLKELEEPWRSRKSRLF